MKKGKFIVIDGGDGAGKSTQVRRLKEYFGDRVVITREPGGSPYAEEIRNLILQSPNASQADAKTLAGLFWAARADHIKNTVLPALEAGKIVVSDRFDSSTFAYQIYAQGHNELKKTFPKFRDFFLEECKPDLYVYFDISVEEGLKRKDNDGVEKNHLDERELEFYHRMREGYTRFFEIIDEPHVVIDASKSIEDVFQDLIRVIG